MAGAAAERAAGSAGPPAEVPVCRNCGAPVAEAFCPRCGQETTVALPSARQFLKDAAGRYVAIDGRLWRTLAALLFHPGFLTREYFAGRRRRYVRPARLFLVLSLVMFAAMRVAVGVPQVDAVIVVDPAEEGPAAIAPPVPAKPPDTTGDRVRAAAERLRDETKSTGAGVVMPGFALRFEDDAHLRIDGPGPVVQALDGRLARFNALPRQERMEQLVLGTLRYGPYAMFVLLPAFAFLLMALHRRARRHPGRPALYSEHLVFAAHNHAFFFLAVTLMVVLPFKPLWFALTLWCLVYALWSLRVVYGGHWLAILARSWVAAIAYLVLFGFVTVALVLAAVLLR